MWKIIELNYPVVKWFLSNIASRHLKRVSFTFTSRPSALFYFIFISKYDFQCLPTLNCHYLLCRGLWGKCSQGACLKLISNENRSDLDGFIMCCMLLLCTEAAGEPPHLHQNEPAQLQEHRSASYGNLVLLRRQLWQFWIWWFWDLGMTWMFPYIKLTLQMPKRSKTVLYTSLLKSFEDDVLFFLLIEETAKTDEKLCSEWESV